MPIRSSSAPDRTVFFPDWPTRLRAAEALPRGRREAFRDTISRFLSFCRERARPATVRAAREFVELKRLEHPPGPGRLQEWKEALNWYFREARAVRRPAISGLPSLGRADLGRTPWEQALIAGMRERHLAWRTEQSYRGWMWRFVRFLGKRKIADAGAPEVKAFLSQLAVRERLGAAAQKQALNAVAFYFREIEGRDPGHFGDFVRARRRVRVPVVLNRTECERLFEALEGTPRLMAELMFGSGLRLTELLRLRVKDVDLERGQLVVRAGKGDKDRYTVLQGIAEGIDPSAPTPPDMRVRIRRFQSD